MSKTQTKLSQGKKIQIPQVNDSNLLKENADIFKSRRNDLNSYGKGSESFSSRFKQKAFLKKGFKSSK